MKKLKVTYGDGDQFFKLSTPCPFLGERIMVGSPHCSECKFCVLRISGTVFCVGDEHPLTD